MARINVYLTFEGDCEEAFNFYKSVFGGEFRYIGRFSDMPADENYQVPEEDKNKVMHVSLPISEETILLGSDTSSSHGPPLTIGNNYSISVSTDTKEEADNIFNKLSAGGNITMPIDDMFWGSYYGMLIDKFSINWMVGTETSETQG